VGGYARDKPLPLGMESMTLSPIPLEAVLFLPTDVSQQSPRIEPRIEVRGQTMRNISDQSCPSGLSGSFS